jgi:hypothetical protein
MERVSKETRGGNGMKLGTHNYKKYKSECKKEYLMLDFYGHE